MVQQLLIDIAPYVVSVSLLLAPAYFLLFPKSSRVRQRRLFHPDGPFVSEIGFGAWPIAGAFGEVDRQLGIKTVQAAVRLGLTFIDTADYYETPTFHKAQGIAGGSETVIGLALQQDPSLDAFVTTKVSALPHTAAKIKSKCADSLRNLQLPSLPLLQLHSYDVDTPIRERMSALAGLQAEGKISYIGLNNTTLEQLEEAWATDTRFHTLQVRYHMFSRKEIEAEIAPCKPPRPSPLRGLGCGCRESQT